VITERHEHAACRRRTYEENHYLAKRQVQVTINTFAHMNREITESMARLKLSIAEAARKGLR
jgi:hypothetical protein